MGLPGAERPGQSTAGNRVRLQEAFRAQDSVPQPWRLMEENQLQKHTTGRPAPEPKCEPA